jgi:hypothetical protein
MAPIFRGDNNLCRVIIALVIFKHCCRLVVALRQRIVYQVAQLLKPLSRSDNTNIAKIVQPYRDRTNSLQAVLKK